MVVLLVLVPFAAYGQYTVGTQVPDFTLNDNSGNSVSLSDYSGKVVVLYFFTST
ncbi:MAG: redoxin domain-containing protein [bacterium]|nr:redoxin domain-containing protein [bacterium]